MSELALPEEVTQEITVIDQRVMSIKVIDNETFIQAGEIFKAIGAMEKKIKLFFNGTTENPGMKAKAYSTWKSICAAEDAELSKLKPLKDHVNKEQTVYSIEQEKIRKAVEERLRLAAIKKEEEDRLAAAIQAEAEGATEEAEEILETPVIFPPPIVEKSVPKVAGQALATTWKHRVTSLQLLCKAVAEGKAPITCIQANDVFLGQQARAGKGEIKYSGVEFFSEQSMRGVRS